MTCIYKVTVTTVTGPGKEYLYRITWLNRDTNEENFFEVSAAEMTPEDITSITSQWHLPEHRLEIGRKLFRFLDGNARHFQRALTRARENAMPLTLHLCTDKTIADWPFELLSLDDSFLLVQDVHLVRCVSDWGKKNIAPPQNRPLKLLFMACSPLDTKPELDFEKEEEAIFQATTDLAVDMDVEDTGSLEGLRSQLLKSAYDVVHLSGHANLDEHGQPYFKMEDETGAAKPVFPKGLWHDALQENLPRVVFLSGCRTGETPNNPDFKAEVSFAQELVSNHHIESVLGWGRSVGDEQASLAAKFIYLELSKGRDLLTAVQRARLEMSLKYRYVDRWDWPQLRVFSGEAGAAPLVEKGQDAKPVPRDLTHTYLEDSQVKILKTGFVGRRRPLQRALRALKTDKSKTGVFLHGAGGLGKSCLAGKICERFSKHRLIVVHGRLDTMSLQAALKKAFVLAREQTGLEVLGSGNEMTDILAELCASVFKENRYVLVLDDFEQNQEGWDRGEPGSLLPETAALLTVLLEYLPFCGKMSQAIITGRYVFALDHQGHDLVEKRLERICLTGFVETEQLKKVKELPHIYAYPDREAVEMLTAAGRGNPRLMEWLDTLVGEIGETNVPGLVAAVKGKQEEFIRRHVVRELLECGGKEMAEFFSRLSVYRRPVFLEGVKKIGEQAGVKEWEKILRRGIALGLVEEDQARKMVEVTPLLREELVSALKDTEPVHRAAFTYYTQVCENREEIDPVLWEEWIYHALSCGEKVVASRQGGRLVSHLRERLAFRESRRIGEWILVVLAEKKKKLASAEDAYLLNALAYTIDDLGDHRKAIDYYDQALAILKKAYGEQHPDVAAALNNLGEAWKELGEPRKAIDYYDRALVIDEKVYGPEHPEVATDLNNLGAAWKDLGEPRKAIDYVDRALAIWKTVYGEQHPNIASTLNNLGAAWDDLGEKEKAIGYYEQALAIDEKTFGPEHPAVARDLNNLGLAWKELGEPRKAIDYYDRALAIDEKTFGPEHPAVARDLNNLGGVYFALEQKQQAKEFFSRAYTIWKKFFGEEHPNTRIAKGWLDDC